MENKKLFVWDFHGVLEKGNTSVVKKLIDLVLKDFGIEKEITLKEVNDWYGLSWFDYFKLAVPKGNQKLWEAMVSKVLSFQEEGWDIIKKHLKSREFAKDVLKKIQESGHENIVVSNARPKDIRKFVGLLGISRYFDDIIGVDAPYNYRSGEKIHNIKGDVLFDFFKDKKYDKVIMIGDKESDIQAGKKCGAITYLFTGPELSNEKKDIEADYKISDLRELLREI